ncbi:MAG: type II toxin-antitoxin system RelE/ParE family toxin [Planctomycetota bacterium]
MTYAVEITRPAEADVREVVSFLRSRSAAGAAAWRTAFTTALSRLTSDPTALPFAAESSLFAEDVRQLLFKTKSGRKYRAVFVVRGATVYVLRVRAPGQNLLDVGGIDFPS